MTGLIDKIMDYLANKFASPVEEVTFTRSSSISTGAAYGLYDKFTDTMRINFRASNNSNISTSAVLFKIDDAFRGYRPSEAKSGSCMEMNSSSVAGIGPCTINSNGEIKQGASNAARYIIGVIEYKVGASN